VWLAGRLFPNKNPFRKSVSNPELDGIISKASGCRHQINTDVFVVLLP
jgi:hypothetical protein